MTIIDFLSARFHYTFGPRAPMVRVRSGASLRVICPDADNQWPDGSLLSREARLLDVPGIFEGNPMAGPVFVEGAAVGDALAVTIGAIELDREVGYTSVGPRHGALSLDLMLDPSVVPGDASASVPRHNYEWQIDAKRGVAQIRNALGADPIVVPLDPFVGCIGVCPQWGQSVSTLLCGSHGGNMDLPGVRPGATLYLPVFVEGALLSMGDIHAAQGHGEIIGGGIEMSGKINCTIDVIKGQTLKGPRVRDAKSIGAIATDGNLRIAMEKAYADLLNWLSVDLKLNRWDAYNLISQTGSVTIGGVSLPPHAVAASVPIDVLPARVRGLLEKDRR